MNGNLLVVCLAGVTSVGAVVPGAWESFSTQTNADAWTMYDDADGGLYFPGWSDGEDPFIGATIQSDSIYLYADETVAAGAFTGDYAAAGVESISMDVFLADPLLIDYFDVAILADLGGQQRYYFTDSFLGESFAEPGWYALEFSFREPWYYWDAAAGPDGAWVEAIMSAAELSDVIEIGITFFHVGSNTTVTDVGIDNVSLNHPLIRPELAVNVTAGMAELSFQPLAAHVYELEQFDVVTEGWTPVAGQTGILGTDPFSFTEPVTGTSLFRCVARPYYTEVVTDP